MTKNRTALTTLLAAPAFTGWPRFASETLLADEACCSKTTAALQVAARFNLRYEVVLSTAQLPYAVGAADVEKLDALLATVKAAAIKTRSMDETVRTAEDLGVVDGEDYAEHCATKDATTAALDAVETWARLY